MAESYEDVESTVVWPDGTLRARAEPDLIEIRPERAYDEQSPSTLFLPNNTLCCSYDREFLGAAGREVLNLYDAQERL